MATLTVKKLLALTPEEISGLDVKTLRKYTSVLSSAANKRIQRLRKSGVSASSIAYQNVMRSGTGKFGTRNKSLNQLRNEYKRVRMFLNAKTSTVTGTRKLQSELVERFDTELSQNQINKLWDTYNTLEAYNPLGIQRVGSEQIQRYIAEQVEAGLSVEEIIQSAQNEIERAYLAEMEEYNSVMSEIEESMWFE